MRLFTFNDKNISEIALYKELVFSLNECINSKGSVNFYVSGGKSPKDLFIKLSKEKLDWTKVNVFLVDERILPTNHEDSNTNLVKQNLLQNDASKANLITCIKDELINDYEALKNHANNIYQTPDILILGMGADAHTASIFPTATNLDELLSDENQAYHIVKTPNYDRISLSLESILKAKRIFLNISGDEKYQVFLLACKEKNKKYPISYVINSKGNLDVYYAK